MPGLRTGHFSSVEIKHRRLNHCVEDADVNGKALFIEEGQNIFLLLLTHSGFRENLFSCLHGNGHPGIEVVEFLFVNVPLEVGNQKCRN